ncbi:MAG: O-antigen ligase family protein [Bacteroidota bacterium]
MKEQTEVRHRLLTDISVFIMITSVVFISVLSGYKAGFLSLVISFLTLTIIGITTSWRFVKNPPILKTYIFFTLLNLISVFYALNIVFVFDIVFKMIAVCIMMVVCLNYCVSLKYINRLILFFLASSAILALYNSYFYVPNIFRELPFGGSNPVGLIMFISIVLIIFYTFLFTKKTLMLLPLYFYVLFLTESQKSTLSLLIILIIYLALIFIFYKVKAAFKYLISGVIIITIAVSLLTLNKNLDSALQRTFATVESVLTGVKVEGAAGGSIGEGFRAELKERGWNYFANSPFLGYGTNNFRALHLRDYNFSTYTHFTPLEVILSIGFLGFFIYYAIYIIVLKNIFTAIINYRQHIFAFLFATIISAIVIGFYMQTYADMSLHLLLILITCFLKINNHQYKVQ